MKIAIHDFGIIGRSVFRVAIGTKTIGAIRAASSTSH